MKLKSASLTLALFGVLALPAMADVTVAFKDSDKYLDLGRTQKEQGQNRAALEKHFQHLGNKLAKNEKLSIDVLDIDMAGEQDYRGTRLNHDVRILRPVTWPAIKLRYTLTSDGNTIAGGEEFVSDLSYQISMNRYSTDDEYRYEKAMLDRWFQERIVQRKVAQK